MTEVSRHAGERLASVDARLLRSAAVGGLIGGLALFLVMAVYNAEKGMGFWSILNACFAAWVYKSARMSPMMGESGGKPMMGESAGKPMVGHEMMNSPLVASHVAVGSALHLLMSAVSGVTFVVVLALLLRIGGRAVTATLATPVGYIVAGAAGGALLFVIMMYGAAPLWNTTIVHFTARVPFFLSHLLFGAIATGWVYATQAGRESPAVAGPAALRHRTA